jgi:hypothetical protein
MERCGLVGLHFLEFLENCIIDNICVIYNFIIHISNGPNFCLKRCSILFTNEVMLIILWRVLKYIIIIIIITGSTALRGPWPSSEGSASWSIRLLLLDISRQESFPGWGCQPHAQPPGYPGGPMFSVRVVSLSWLVPILKRQYLAFCPCMT